MITCMLYSTVKQKYKTQRRPYCELGIRTGSCFYHMRYVIMFVFKCHFPISKQQYSCVPTNTTSGTGTANPSEEHKCTSVVCGIRVAQSIFLCYVHCRSLFVFFFLIFLGIVLPVPFTASNIPFGIFKLFQHLESSHQCLCVILFSVLTTRTI